MNEVSITLIFDKALEPEGCDHMTTFMHYIAGDAGYFIVCRACGFVVDSGMAGHN